MFLSPVFLVEARNIERVKPLVQCLTHSTSKNPSEFAILSLASSPVYTIISRYNGGAGAVEEWVRRTLRRTSTTPTTLVLFGLERHLEARRGNLIRFWMTKGSLAGGQKTHEGLRTTGFRSRLADLDLSQKGSSHSRPSLFEVVTGQPRRHETELKVGREKRSLKHGAVRRVDYVG
jgi:hypothetical protein